MIRPKKRYLLFYLYSEEEISMQEILGEILRSTKYTLGEILVAKMNLRLIDYDEKKQYGIIRISNKYTEALRASLVLINNINRKKAFLYVRSISGSLKKLQKKVKLYEKKPQKHT